MTTPAPLTGEDRAELANRLPAWTVDGEVLRRSLEFSNFVDAWEFMERVAFIAEEFQHHPDWSNSWNRVEIGITTHSAGCLTQLDLAFAEAVDALS
ncbi:MAG TPA: 4a-hydroxytetrahydrobiopterin dehydratase [Acidimicrobiaceae bacterium]|nr:4a-hydroxytetrahydrobiopterin dehydratase [Acidimicrobiaceae bacterium]HCV34050.1 4a-hydroxytetrahydrobiopterin dehydratase [Acidimicrobiaceae bacterium]|tara:strand:- start:266 stop:553 length:288 start_codon:yes stop_codon:yes gene_type:complete